MSDDLRSFSSDDEDEYQMSAAFVTPIKTASAKADSDEDDEFMDGYEDVIFTPMKMSSASFATPTVAKQPLKSKKLNQNLDVTQVAGAIFYQGVFISRIMSEQDYNTTCKYVEVKESALDRKGLFATKAMKRMCFISAYEGNEILDNQYLAEQNDYALELYEGHFIDASETGYDNPNQLGHILNSVSPAEAIAKPNCIYITILVVKEDGSKVIKGGVWLDQPVQQGEELLCDYHWRILTERSTCPCKNCLEDLRLSKITNTTALHTPEDVVSTMSSGKRKITPVTKRRVVDDSPALRYNVRASTVAARGRR